jgi:hypothetical protein
MINGLGLHGDEGQSVIVFSLFGPNITKMTKEHLYEPFLDIPRVTDIIHHSSISAYKKTCLAILCSAEFFKSHTFSPNEISVSIKENA